MDVSNRYSMNRRSSFIEDGFTVSVTLNNKQHKISFQSSVTVDHVKFEIIKQFYPPNEQSQDYFIALNKTEILQIEFVRFIFAHDDIQKSLLIKKSIEVYLLPKSKEIIARKNKADLIKKQIGTFNSSGNTTKKIATATATATTTNTNVKSQPQPPSLKKLPSQQNVLQQKIINNNSKSDSGNTTPRSNPLVVVDKQQSQQQQQQQQQQSTSPSTSLSPSTSTTPISLSTSNSNGDLNSIASTSVGTDGQNQEDLTTEILKLQLQQQLVLLEDEELSFQSTLLAGDSGYTDTEDELSEKENDNQPIFSLSPQSSTTPKQQAPIVPPRTYEGASVSNNSGAAVSSSTPSPSKSTNEILTFKKEPISPKVQPPPTFLLKEFSTTTNVDQKPTSTADQVTTTATTTVQQQPSSSSSPSSPPIVSESPVQLVEEENNTHWTNYLSMKPLKQSLNEIPIQIQIKNNYLVMGCNKNFTSTEFKSYLVSNLESIIQSIKVGTFATNDISSQTIAFKKNTVLCDQFIESINQKPNNIPQLIVLKPGMQDLFKENDNMISGSPNVNSNSNNSNNNNNNSNSSNSNNNGMATGFKFSGASSLNLNMLHNNMQNIINGNTSGSNNNSPNLNVGSMIVKRSGADSRGGLVNSSGGLQIRNTNFSLGEQRDHNAKIIQQKKKLTTIQISSLLGKPLNWSNTENEIKYFRNITEQIFDFQTLDARDRVKITISPMTDAPADPLLPSSFRVKCYLPPDNHSTTINIMSSDSIALMIEKIINKHNTSTKLIASDHTNSDYVIRITGTSDHVFDTDQLVTNLIVVRNRLQRKKDIKFSLVHKSSLPKIYIDGYSPEICTLNENNNFIGNNNNSNSNNNNSLSTSPTTIVPASILSSSQSFINFNGNVQQQNLTSYGSPVNSISYPISPRSNNNNNNNNSNNNNNNNNNNNIDQNLNGRSILLYEINRPFEIRIICLENLNPILIQKYLGTDSNVSLNEIKLSIQAELYHGEDILTEPMETVVNAGSNLLWCEWLRSALLMSDIPRATKLCFTVYAQHGDKQKLSIGWANLQVIDYHSQLLNGVISLILWPGSRIDTPDFNVPSPSLVIEFCQFPFPVVFPKPEMMERTEIRDYVESRKEDSQRLDELIQKDSLYVLTLSDRKFIWMYRMHLQTNPASLPKVLQSLRWNNPQEVKEAHRLLSIWSPLSPLEALELLDIKFADELVREYAVNCLRTLSDSDLALYLLQLVQSLKHEPYHNSALSRFLIQRALNNRAIIGHPFFWHLEAEMHNPKISERYSLVLETFLKGCGNQRHEFVKQMEVVTKLQSIAKLVKEAQPNKRKALLHDELNRMSWPNTFHLPTSPSTETCGVIVSECRWLDSFTVPLYLVFQNVDPVGDPISVIFKTGDDLRQDILTLQMISVMDNIWKQSGLDLHLSIYNVTAISEDTGFIEVVPDSDTTASIQKAAGGVTAAFTKTPLANWLKERNPSTSDYDYAVQNFIHSLAGYCVATYILGISDRHNDNIMVSNSGHLFHIDFAHFLGNIMKFHGYKREKAPFVLTPEFAHVMGGEKSQSFKWFTDLCCLSYKFLRKHRNLFINLFCLMISTGIPELSTKEDISYLKDAFLMDVPDEEAAASFERLIQKSLKTKTTQLLFAFHILAKSDLKNEE